jgi:hypothetical protein
MYYRKVESSTYNTMAIKFSVFSIDFQIIIYSFYTFVSNDSNTS